MEPYYTLHTKVGRNVSGSLFRTADTLPEALGYGGELLARFIDRPGSPIIIVRRSDTENVVYATLRLGAK